MTTDPQRHQRRLLAFAWLLCGAGATFFTCNAPSAAASTISLRRRADLAYSRALQLRTALENGPQPGPMSYEKVIDAFRLVYHIDPGYPGTPSALAAAAEIYQEMGLRFANDRYYAKAIEAYEFLIAQYPYARLSADALFTIAEIYRSGIENPEAARAAYEEYVKRYPQAEKTPLARQQIARISEQLAKADAAAAESTHKSVPAAALPAPGSLLEQRTRANRIEDVTAIRQWVGTNYTRIVIGLAGPVKFNAIHLQRPARLVFDLSNTRISPDLKRKVFPAESGYLQRIRIAQFTPTVTRIVLDVPEIEEYSVFSLPNPFRLIVDIHGSSQIRTAGNSMHAAVNPRIPPSRSQEAAIDRPGSPEAEIAERQAAPHPDAPIARATHSTIGGQGGPADANVSVLPPASDLRTPSPTLTRALGLKIRRIVIDPGHGGHDTGTIGQGGLEEKNVVLDVAIRLRKLILTRMGCDVVMTRSTDKFIPLEERTAIANAAGADLFVSIHANSSPSLTARGVETYYLNFTSDLEALRLAARENATSQDSVYQLQSLVKKIALSAKIDESEKFAATVDHQLSRRLALDGHPQPDRGVKKAPFVVLIGANMPSILVEISFLSDYRDARLLRNEAYREQIALGLYNGIARYAESLGTIRLAQMQGTRGKQHTTPSF